MRNRIFRSIVIAALTSALVFPIGARWSDLPVAASEMELPVSEEIILESDEIDVPEIEPEEDALAAADEIEQSSGDMEQEESSVAEEESQQEDPTEQPIPEEIISAIAESATFDTSQLQNQPSAQNNVLTFTFEKDIVLPFTQTMENYSEETLKTVTLLDGVIVKDENGQDVQPWVSDLGGFAASDLTSVGKTFSITYSAKHPVSGEVQTAVRDAVVGPVSGRATRAAVYQLNVNTADAGYQLLQLLNKTDTTDKIPVEMTIQLQGGNQLELKESLFIFLNDRTSPQERIIHFESTSPTTIKASTQSSTFNDGSRIIYIAGDGDLTLDFSNVTLDGSSEIAGIRVRDNANVTLNKAVINNCSAKVDSPEDQYGGALRIDGSGTVILNDCSFVNNIADMNGGAVAVMNGATAQAGNSTVNLNKAQNGGGVYVAKGDLSLNSMQFTSNWATQFGGGIYMDQGEASLQTASFVSNRADKNGGAVYVKENGNINVQNTSFTTNIAYGMNKFEGGGAIFTEDKSYSNLHTMPDTMFVSNFALTSYNSTPTEFSHLTNIGYNNVSIYGTHAINNYDINYHDGATSVLKLIKVPTVVDYGTLTIPQALDDQWRQPEDVQYSVYNASVDYQDYAIVVQSTMANWTLNVNIDDLISDGNHNLGKALAYRRSNQSITNGVILDENNAGNPIDAIRKTYGVPKWDPNKDEGLLLNTAVSSSTPTTGQYTSVITWSLQIVA